MTGARLGTAGTGRNFSIGTPLVSGSPVRLARIAMQDRLEFPRPEAANNGCVAAPRCSTGRVAFGTALLSSASITKLLLQCILIPVLARLLGPGIFGEMSIAMSFVLLANMLSDGGMGAALIREQDPDQELESTVYWLSALIGVALAAIVGLLAWPIAVLYGERNLFPVLLALAPILVLSSSISVANARIVRLQRFEVFAAGDIGCAIVSAAAGLLLAFHGFGIWSLVVQQTVFWMAKTAWISVAAGFRPDFALRLKSARPLLRFSANNLAANVADFAGRNAPVLLVGGLLGTAAVARFAMSYQLTRVAEMVVSDPVNLATFSGVSAAADRREANDFVVTAMRILLLLLLPLFVGLALTADLLAPLVLGHRWAGTGPALAALAPGALFLCLYRFATAVLLGKGHSGKTFKLTLLTGIATSLGTLAGVHFGVTWAVAGFSMGALALAPLYLRSLARCLQLSFADMLSAGGTSFAATAGMVCTVLLIRVLSDGFSPVVQFAMAVVGGALGFAATAMLLGGREILNDIRTLRKRVPERRKPDPAAWSFLPSAIEEASPPLEPVG
ncbi:MAG: lipopolysaccharide biosynthesis protein [Rhizomicrobium sp.]